MLVLHVLLPIIDRYFMCSIAIYVYCNNVRVYKNFNCFWHSVYTCINYTAHTSNYYNILFIVIIIIHSIIYVHIHYDYIVVYYCIYKK